MEAWQKKLAPCKGQQLVTYHNSWPYFARRFGLTTGMFLEPKPGIPPTPSHLAQVILQMKKEKARLIFADVYLDQRTAETVAARTDSKVLMVTQFPGGVKGTEAGYVALMDYLVDGAAKAFADAK
jgi:zinc/manganese transport system substrate-binding protein